MKVAQELQENNTREVWNRMKTSQAGSRRTAVQQMGMKGEQTKFNLLNHPTVAITTAAYATHHRH